jgi:hypothetical protein
MSTAAVPTDRLANYFVSYLFDRYQGTRHVRQVAPWIGFILKAIERVTGGIIRPHRTRQIVFKYRGRRFKACYRHDAGPRGGIQIIEILLGRGGPEGEVALNITDLDEAEDAYLTFENRLDQFIDGPSLPNND